MFLEVIFYNIFIIYYVYLYFDDIFSTDSSGVAKYNLEILIRFTKKKGDNSKIQ